MKGWISKHRKVLENPIVKMAKVKSPYEAWDILLFKVNHKERKVVIGNEIIKVNRGETITSLQKLQKEFGWGSTRTRSFLKLLQADGMITYESNTKYTKILVNNYEKYQNIQHDNNTLPTRNQKTNNKRPNTNNNDINNDINNVNKRKQKFINETLSVIKNKNIDIEVSNLEAFTDYWTELNRSKTKMKFELQQTFEVSRRLKTWVKNDSNFYNKANSLKPLKKKKKFKHSTTYKHYIGYCGNTKCSKYGHSDFYDIWETDKGLSQTKCCGTEVLPERIAVQIQDINAEA